MELAGDTGHGDGNTAVEDWHDHVGHADDYECDG